MLMLVATEGALFGCLFGTYFYLRVEASNWPPDGVPPPAVVTPVILAVVLAATAVPLVFAQRAAGLGRVSAVRALLAGGLLVQAGYFAYQVHDFEDQLRSFTPQANAYGSIYYVLLGADQGHVAVGLLLDLWLLLKLARGLTTYRLNALRAISLYWYAVGALTVLVALTLASARL